MSVSHTLTYCFLQITDAEHNTCLITSRDQYTIRLFYLSFLRHGTYIRASAHTRNRLILLELTSSVPKHKFMAWNFMQLIGIVNVKRSGIHVFIKVSDIPIKTAKVNDIPSKQTGFCCHLRSFSCGCGYDYYGDIR